MLLNVRVFKARGNLRRSYCGGQSGGVHRPGSSSSRHQEVTRPYFPGVCFASTRCATVEPGQTWELAPFCGRSTCVKPEGEENSGHLLELVEDCGPLPKPNPKCKLSDKTNKTAAFPDCCPIFECEAGVVLEYPEIPTVPPPPSEKKDAKA